MAFQECVSELRARGIPPANGGIGDYLQDESRFQGFAEVLIRARDPNHVVETIKIAVRHGIRVTVVSGKTSLTGACVPLGGIILDVRGIDRIDQLDPSRVGPGVVLKHYKDHLAGLGLFFPPDPTSEDSCTLGGNVACNASGALSYLYGPTRDYIRGLTLALPNGTILRIERGQVMATQGRFSIPSNLLTPRDSPALTLPVPTRGAPPWTTCKSAAGLYASDPMDLVDLFIGSEGILGIFLEIRTRLLPPRNPYVALLLYLPSRELTVDLVGLLDAMKRRAERGPSGGWEEIERRLQDLAGGDVPGLPGRFDALFPACMEWFGTSVASLLAPERARRLRTAYGCLYVEQEYPPHHDPIHVLTQWADLVHLINERRPHRAGGIRTEAALDEKQIRALRLERKAIPERLNELIRPGMVKIDMDFAVPFSRLGWLMDLYDRVLPAGRSYVFGHIGNAHLHVNLLPENEEERQGFQHLYQILAQEICSAGGTVSAEHGIGKLKHEPLKMMLGVEGLARIEEIKRTLDPEWILNVGNMISAVGE